MCIADETSDSGQREWITHSSVFSRGGDVIERIIPSYNALQSYVTGTAGRNQ